MRSVDLLSGFILDFVCWRISLFSLSCATEDGVEMTTREVSELLCNSVQSLASY